MAIHLIKFLKTKGEEIEGISIIEETEKKIEVRRIEGKSGETPNKCCKVNNQKMQTQKLQETILKRKVISPKYYFKEGKTIGVINNVTNKYLEPNKQEKNMVEQTSLNESKIKIQEDRRRRLREDERFRVLNVIKGDTEKVSQKERSEEIKELDVKTLEVKSIETNLNQRECFNFQKVYLNDMDKRKEIDKTFNIRDIQKDHTIEKLRLNEKEKENFKDKVNTVIKAPGIKEKDQFEKNRTCDESDQNKRKKIKADADKNELTKEGTIEKCVEEECEDECAVEDRSKSLMVSTFLW